MADDFLNPDVEGLRALYAEVFARPPGPIDIYKVKKRPEEIFAIEAVEKIELGTVVRDLAKLKNRLALGTEKELNKAKKRGLQDPQRSKDYAIAEESESTAQYALVVAFMAMLPRGLDGAMLHNTALYLCYGMCEKAKI